jgi:U3 small nucleolar RNA-associated protein 5
VACCFARPQIANYDFPNVSFVTHLSPSLLLVSSSSSMSLYNLTDPDAPPLTLPLPSAAIQAALSPDGNSFLAVTSCGTVLHSAASPSAPNPPSTSAPSAAVGAAFLADSSAVVYSLTGGGSSVAASALPLDLSSPVLSLPPLEQSADAPTKPAASPKRAANELQQSVQGAGDRGSTAPAQELKRRRAEADAAEEGDDGPTVADRLATLSSALDADSDEEDGGLPEGAARPDFSKADSLGLLLGQALTSNDDAQLEVCFSCHDKAVILATVKSLTPANVMGLLAKVVDRISRRPARAQVLGAWLLCLMKAHAATFLSNEVLARKLAPVQGLLRERTETMGDLIRLDGRLGVLEFLM